MGLVEGTECMCQGFGSSGAAGVAAAGTDQGLPCASHSSLRTFPPLASVTHTLDNSH